MISIDLINFIKNDLKLRHKGGRSQKFVLTLNNKDIICDDQETVQTTIQSCQDKFSKFTNWITYQKTVKQSSPDIDHYLKTVSSDLSSAIKQILQQKSAVKVKMNEVLGCPLDMIYKTVPQPSSTLNNIDLMILSGLKFCAQDNSLYFLRNGALRLIGSFESVKKDPTINKLCLEIQRNITENFNENVNTELSKFIQQQVNKLTEAKRNLMMLTQSSLDEGNQKWEDIEIKLDDDHIFIPSKFASKDRINAIEASVDAFVIDEFWNLVPTSIFTSKVVVLKSKYEQIELLNDNGHCIKMLEWRGFHFETFKSDEILNEQRYLKNIFDHLLSRLRDDEFFRLNEIPLTYTNDENINPLFKFKKETLVKNLPEDCYKTLDECKNLSLLKSWMNEDEYRLAMAWAYSCIFPTEISKIGLLLWTGGGTGKSSYVAMIKEAMLLGSNAKESDIYFEIKGTKFDDDQRNWVPDGEAGITKAALINVDEATTRTIELYKDFSGSAAGNKLNLRKNYEDAITYEIKGKFIFTTNKGLQLTSDDGSLLRRVAIIKHNEIKNVLGYEAVSNEDIVKEYKKQIPMMIYEGKKAIKEIKELGYESIDAYAMKSVNITKNLKESTATSTNEMMYIRVWDYLIDKSKQQGIEWNNEIKLQAGVLQGAYETICQEDGEDPNYWKFFKRWIFENETLFEKKPFKKQASNYLSVKIEGNRFTSEINKKNCNNIWHLYPLKQRGEK